MPSAHTLPVFNVPVEDALAAARVDMRSQLPFDVAALAAEMSRSERLEREGHAAQILCAGSELRLVLVALRAGCRIAEHQTVQQATVHTLLGHARLHVPGGDCEIPAGVMVVLRGALVHEIEAIETSVMLFSLVYREPPS